MNDMADTFEADIDLEPEALETETPEADQVEAEAGDDEVIVTIGEDAPPPEEEEDRAAPEWVRNLRKENRDLKRKAKELESKLTAPAPTKTDLGPKPTLEGSDYDADRFERDLLAWNESKRKHDADQEALRAEQEAQNKAWQDRVQTYQGAKASLRVKDFDDAEDAVKEALSVTQQGIIVQGAKDPALLVYALGKNPAKVKELSEIKDPVQFAFAVARLEATVKATTRKPTTAPETTLTGNARPSGSVDKQLEKLRADADRTGDRSKVAAYLRQTRK
jgi:hypothetical protein